MAKFTISQPKTFKADVPIPQLGGEPLLVPFEFNVFTREALAKIQDEWVKNEPHVTGDDITHVDYIKKVNASKVKQVKQLVVGWGFDDTYNDENIAHLVNTIIGSDEAIVRTFFTEIAKARLGN